MTQKVAVIGTGRMGFALATALFKKGFATIVWNRSLSKTEPLARLGIRVASSLREAALEADVVIVNVSDYDTTMQLLQHADIESALRGKILVQLSTGTPDEARQIECWARANGIDYLDGAIAGYPSSIGTPEGTIFYSGSSELFERVKPVLLAFGDNALLVGSEIGQASAYDLSILTFALGAMFGFLQGYIVWEAEGLSAGGFMPFVKSMMPVLEEILSGIHTRVQKGEYSDTQASLEAYRPVPKDLIGWCKDRRADHTIADAHFDLIDKAVKRGHGQSDFAYLYEILKKGEANA